MEERRYTDDEVAEILRLAASSTSRSEHVAGSHGLTLSELAAIGEEVGIPSEQIARAAASLEMDRRRLPQRTVLGIPIAVGQTVDLPRAPTDREWSILLGEIREMFQASGRESSTTVSRNWRNGNLHFVVEPTETGYRLRMGTRKSDAPAGLSLAFFFLVTALLLLFIRDGGTDDLFLSVLFASMAVGAVSLNAVRLPRWAAEREEQMKYIAERAIQLLSRPPDDSPLPGTVD